MAPPPKWAQKIIEEVWSTQTGRYPTVNWRRGGGKPSVVDGTEYWSQNAFYTSGHCKYWTNEIAITAGKKAPRWEQKMVLLHELAHAISPGGHDDRFWRTAWTLYRRFNLPIQKCQKREGPRTGRKWRLATGRGELCPKAAA